MWVLATEATAHPQLPRGGCKAQIYSFLSSGQQITNYRGREIVKSVLLQHEFEIGAFALLCKELKALSKQASAVYVK